jgi:bla regulator protein BlaR1
MISYIFKSAECLAFMFILYHFFLEKEKMLRFNRFYLLFSIGLSLMVPFISYTVKSSAETPLVTTVKNATEAHAVIESSFERASNETSIAPWLTIIFGIYLLVVLYRLIKFSRNVYFLISQQKNSEPIFYKDVTVFMVNEPIPSYSFLNSIFISQADYENEATRKSLLSHEYSHVRQKHSWDVLLIELLHVFLWFNPLIILYKKAIRLNHEFLADAEAAAETEDVYSYQQLLLIKASANTNFQLASNFNYPIIKKRLIMLQQTTSALRATSKKLLLVPFVIVAILFFTTKIVAQKPPEIVAVDIPMKNVPYTKEGVSQKLLDEYAAILEKHKRIDKKGDVEYDISEEVQERLSFIYHKMNRAQQKSVKLRFFSYTATVAAYYSKPGTI